MAETIQENEGNRSKSNNEKSKDKKEKTRPLTKVIIRRLPPTMSEETFLEQISPIPDHDYFYFVNADRTLGVHSFCRAYINFANSTDIFNFKEKFDNYVFVDNRGNEFPAVVEYAPYQGVPKKKSRKNDPKCGTIDTDPHYLEFLESLKVDESEINNKDKTEFTYQVKDDKKQTSTPLLEYLAARKLEKQRIKAERKEERRKRELERKKMREEERRRRKVEYSKTKPSVIDEEVYVDDKGKSYKEKYEDYPRKSSIDDRKSEVKVKDRRYNDGDHLRKTEYRSTYSRSKLREDDRKYDSYKSEIKKEPVKVEKKFEVKKYSEARKERDARRNELKKFRKDADAADTSSVDVEDKRKSVSETKKNQSDILDRDALGDNVELVKNLAESLDEQLVLEDNPTIDCEEKEQQLDNDLDNDNDDNIVASAEKESQNEQDVQSDTEQNSSKASDSSKKVCDKKVQDDKRDPRSERRIRNKDRPSMAIYQPGKARLNVNKEKSTDNEKEDNK